MRLRLAGVAAVALLGATVSTGTEALAATTTSVAMPAQSSIVQGHGGDGDHGHGGDHGSGGDHRGGGDHGSGGDHRGGGDHGDGDRGHGDGGGEHGRDRCYDYYYDYSYCR
jgi:hypothetical protein